MAAAAKEEEAIKTKGIRAFEEMMEERATKEGASRRAINERVAKKMGFHVQAYDAERDAQMRAVAKEEVKLIEKYLERVLSPEARADEEHNAYMRAAAKEEGRLVASEAAPRAYASGGGSAYLEWLLSPEARAAETNTARAEEAARDECRGHVQLWENDNEMDEATYLEMDEATFERWTQDYYEMDQATFERKYGRGG